MARPARKVCPRRVRPLSVPCGFLEVGVERLLPGPRTAFTWPAIVFGVGAGIADAALQALTVQIPDRGWRLAARN